MIGPELFRQIDARYRPMLQNLDIPHPRLMVFFSGPPSSGKSTIAKQLEQYFKGLRVAADDVRIILTDLQPEMSLQDKSETAYEYLSVVMEELVKASPNGLWIIDSSVDRTYDIKYDFAHKHGFKTILLAMRIPEATHREWIIGGGDRPFSSMQGYLEKMPQRREEQKLFLRDHAPDIVVEPGYTIEDIYELVASRMFDATIPAEQTA